MIYEEIKILARHLRNNPTPAESHLWHFIRKKKLSGRKFLRQYPIIYQVEGNELFFFIADFYCHSEKLIIELDGPIHKTLKEKDRHRDEILRDQGLRVLRIDNEEPDEIDRVLAIIENEFGDT